MKTLLLILSIFCAVHSIYSQKLEKVWSSTKELETPESVLYDAVMNKVFVSNIGKDMDKKTGDGFISIMDFNGKITNLKWVTGLNDPKGLAILKGKLYVADMDELVQIDIKSAKIDKKYPAQNAKFLNDVTVGPSGVIYVSDMKDQRIYILEKGVFSSWLYDKNLEGVNGLWFLNGKLYAGNNSLWEITPDSKKMYEMFDETGGIDGLEDIGRGDFIFSNWEGRIFLWSKNKKAKLLDTSSEKLNTADIDYVPGHKYVLVPTFFGNNVDAYKLVW